MIEPLVEEVIKGSIQYSPPPVAGFSQVKIILIVVIILVVFYLFYRFIIKKK